MFCASFSFLLVCVLFCCILDLERIQIPDLYKVSFISTVRRDLRAACEWERGVLASLASTEFITSSTSFIILRENAYYMMEKEVFTSDL